MKKQLLEKYWKGETTVEEEKWLKEHLPDFNEEILSKEYDYFEQLDQFTSLTLEEPFTMDFLENQATKKESKTIKINYFQQYRNLAAAVLVLITFSVVTYRSMNTTLETSTPKIVVEEDPQKAFEIAKESLLLISSKLNKGATYTNQLEKFDKVKVKIKN